MTNTSMIDGPTRDKWHVGVSKKDQPWIDPQFISFNWPFHKYKEIINAYLWGFGFVYMINCESIEIESDLIFLYSKHQKSLLLHSLVYHNSIYFSSLNLQEI